MGNKLVLVGLTIFVTGTAFGWKSLVMEVGAIVMVIGSVLLLLDK